MSQEPYVAGYICSALSKNLRFLQIAQHFLGIPRKRANLQIGTLSGNPQKVLRFLGMPKWRSAFWETPNGAALSGDPRMALRFLGIPRRCCAFWGSPTVSDAANVSHCSAMKMFAFLSRYIVY